MKFSYLMALLMLFTVSCQPDRQEVTLEGLPVFTPTIIHEFDSPDDDIFFDHLGYTTQPLENGAIFLPDRELSNIFKLSSDGNLLSVIADEGRGPGEVQDPNFISRSYNNTLLVYDQGNKKVLRFSPSGDYIEEFILPSWDKGSLAEIYEIDEDLFFTVFRSFEYIFNSDLEPEAYIVIFDKATEKYIQSVTISDRLYARHIVDDRPVGGRMVPFSAEHLRAFNPQNSTFYSLWTEEQTIAQLTTSLDTANTIEFELTREQLSGDEIAAVRDDMSGNLWRAMEPLLPEYKAIADDMMVDEENNFWLKLNHKSEYQKWLILSESGEKLAVARLPEDGLLTHISDQHLGFRLDDHLFALLEPIEL